MILVITVILYYGFDLKFPDDQWSQHRPFQMVMGHLDVTFCEVSITGFANFSEGLLLLYDFVRVLYKFWI